MTADLAEGDGQAAKFGREQQAAELRDDQQFAVRVPEDALHRTVGAIDVDADAVAIGTLGVGADRGEAGEEVGGLVGDGQRVPAQTVRVRVGEARGGRAAVDAAVGMVRGRGADAVEPGAPGLAAGDGEGGGGELLGVEAERRALRRVAAGGQRAGDGLGREFVAEAGEQAGREGGDGIHGALLLLDFRRAEPG